MRKIAIYKINDCVILNNYHVYQIIKNNQDKYTLTSFTSQDTIEVTSKQIIKALPTVEQINEVIERIPYIRTLQIENEKYRQEIYQKTISTFDEVDLIKIIKSVYLRRKRNKYHDYEEKYYHLAKNLFHEEVAVSLKMPLDTVEAYINEKVLEF